MHTADNLRAGMSPENARRDALLKLGGVEQTKESYRERRSNKGRILCFNPGDAPQIALMAAPDVVVGMRDRFSTTLTILMSAVCIVLLIACANVGD
jgi:hypothetical protein